MYPVLWLIALVILLAAEASTVELVSVWFAAGALVAMIAALFGAQLWLQITLFFLTSGLLLIGLRPLVKKYIKPKLVKTNVDAVVGTRGFVTEAIDNLEATGRVKLGGMEWSARSVGAESIPQGALVKVERVEGVKVFVEPVPVPETSEI